MPRMFFNIVSMRNRRNRVHSAHGVNQANLLSVSRQLQTAPGAPLISTKLALVNIRSVANKCFLVNDIIIPYYILCFFLLRQKPTKNKRLFSSPGEFIRIYYYSS